MPGIFDSKNFNGEVFAAYVDTTPNLNRNELIRSRAIKVNTELATTFRDQVGGNFATVPIFGRIGGDAQNYNGSTNISANKTKTYTQGRIVVGRANAWVERDFSYDITGGIDFLNQVANQVGEYWDGVDQSTILSILKGIFSMTGDANLAFVNGHTYDISADADNGMFSETTLNTAMQKALGDNKAKFALAIMHSVVATSLENLNLLSYLKYTDAQGIQRDLGIGTCNGRTVLVDDTMPVETVASAAGVYTVTIGGTPAADDTITVLGTTVTLTSDTAATTTAAATAVVTALGTQDNYTINRSGAVITFTEKSGHYGAGAPTASATGTTTATVATTTAPVIAYNKYTTYVLGEGAFEYTDCGAKVPYETSRDAATNGGQDTLYSRQRKCFAPMGISWTDSSIISPSDEQLETGSKWALANSNEGTAEYYPHKAIPIGRIITRG